MSSHEEDTAVSKVGPEAPPAAEHDCLIVIYRREGEAGARVPLDCLPLRIGRDSDNELVLDEEGVSRRHARIERRDGRVVAMDASSTNGTLLNGVELATIAELKTGDQLTIGSTILKYLDASDAEATFYEQVFASIATDALTGLRSKRVFVDEMAREFSRARRYNRSLSALFIDIDHFKSVNDENGHLFGDMVLSAVANCVLQNCRANDVAARFGGEEIVVLLPETSLEEAYDIAERIRSAVEVYAVTYRETSRSVTVSIGCAELQGSDESEAVFLDRADGKMYEAKHSGRNRVRC
ncbi:MAG: GGDEF domain-containing protein [Polyangiaceae bacterium]